MPPELVDQAIKFQVCFVRNDLLKVVIFLKLGPFERRLITQIMIAWSVSLIKQSNDILSHSCLENHRFPFQGDVMTTCP